MSNERHVPITGGAGYIASLLTGHLLRPGFRATELDDLLFSGDMRDICVSFEKVQPELDYETPLTVEDGEREVLNALRCGIISDPQDQRYRKAPFIVQ